MTTGPTFAALIALSALGLAAAQPAEAESLSFPERGGAISVKFPDLNVAAPADAETLLRRLRHAAMDVCGVSPRNLDFGRYYDSCVGASVSDAVAKIGSPLLTALNTESDRPPAG
jgi:UrcA family protein